jgi:hypothetical protein
MAKIRKFVTSQVVGNNADESIINEIRPYGEIGLYQGNYIESIGEGRLELLIFDGKRTHIQSKVLSPGIFYGYGNDSGDGFGFDTIKLIPDSTLYYNNSNYGNDQYLVVDPTAPNHIHIRAGGTIDQSNADLFLGGEQTHVKISDGYDTVTIRTSQEGEGVINRDWVFDNNGDLTFPMGGAIESAGMGWTGFTNGVTGQPLSIVHKSANINYVGQSLSEIFLLSENENSAGSVWIAVQDLAAESYKQWSFSYDGSVTFPDATVQTTAWTGIPGPYADDAAAATAGVAVGKPYYQVSGQVFVRLT